MRTLWCLLLFLFASRAVAADKAVVGSKVFTESYVLGRLQKRRLRRPGFPPVTNKGWGGTIILWEALKQGPLLPTLITPERFVKEILKLNKDATVEDLRAELNRQGIGMTRELGFNNTYALVMNRKKAEALGIHKISDLRKHPELRAGLNHDF